MFFESLEPGRLADLRKEVLFLEACLTGVKDVLLLKAERLQPKPKLKLMKKQQRLLKRLTGIKRAIAKQELEDKKQRVPRPYSMGW